MLDNNKSSSVSAQDFLLSIEEAQECLRIANILKGHAEIKKSEKEDVVAEVTEAKKFIAKKGDLLNFLEKLQVALQQKSIDVFSQLLTYFVKDVLKKDEKEIKLDLYTSRGMPALKIEATNNGMPEDIYNGNGGSITNIVSAGLRLIALSRLNHRKFIVLDEPDCWMEVSNVPLFTKTISEIANKLKIQTVMVSHFKDSWKLIKDSTRVIELKKEGNMLVTNIINDCNPEVDPNLNYIKTVRLQQVMSHTDTIYELSPYMNCVVGANDIGKSVFSVVLKAIVYNEAVDGIIQHYRPVAKALVELSNGNKVLWERTRETSPDFPQKVRYSLYKSDGSLTQEYNSESVPDFVKKELNMAIVEDIDVHINHQKEPVFLLGNSVKPQDKAKILSLGKESIMIQKLMELVGTKTRLNNSIIKKGEEKFDALNKQITILDGIDDLINKLDDAKSKMQDHLHYLIEKDKLVENIKKLRVLNNVINTKKIKNSMVNVNMLPTEGLHIHITQLETLLKTVSLEKVDTSLKIDSPLPEQFLKEDVLNLKKYLKIVELNKVKSEKINLERLDTKEMCNDIKRLQALVEMGKLSKIKITNNLLIDKNVSNSRELENDIETLRQMTETLRKWKVSSEKGELIKKKIDDQIDSFIKENGGVCVTCGQAIDKRHFGVEHE